MAAPTVAAAKQKKTKDNSFLISPACLKVYRGHLCPRKMNELNNILIAGFSIFYIVGAVAIAALCYFVVSSYEAVREFPPEKFKVTWSKSLWLYFVSIFSFLAFGTLYLLQYYGQGFSIKPNLLVVVWMRWVWVLISGGLFLAVLNYVMRSGKNQGTAQAFFSVCFYLLSIGGLLTATLSQSEPLRVIWIVVSIVSFMISILLTCWPDSILWGENYQDVKQIMFSQCSMYEILMKSLPRKHREASILLWEFIYRFVILIQICVAYVGYIIIWFLSDSNEFTDVATLNTTMLVYLLMDLLFLVPFTTLFIGLTFANLTKKLTATDKVTGHQHIATRYVSK
jgi:hypothetical protein